MTQTLPLQAQTIFSDLRRILVEIDETGVCGSLVEKEIKGGTYLYDQFRAGGKPIQRSLGPESDEIRARAARSKRLREVARSLVRALVAQGCLAPDRETGAVLLGLARAGVFRAGGVLVGTFAFRCYEAELGVRLEDAAAVTQDIDVAMHRTIKVAATKPPVPKLLAGMGYSPGATSADAGARPWRWTKDEMLIEFLTPDTGEGGQVRKLGVHAQQMKFLEFLLEGPIKAPVLYQGGVLVNVPDPARFAIHKLIVAARRDRDSRDKAFKDRLQARWLIEVLAKERPEDLTEAHEDALSRGPAWRDAIGKSVRMIEGAADLLRAAAA